MPVTVSLVLASNPDSLVTASGEVSAGAADVDERIAAERSGLDGLSTTWTGTASSAALNHAEDMLTAQRRYRDTLHALGRELAAAGGELAHLRSEIADLVAGVEATLFHIADDGTTTPGPILATLAKLSPVLAMDVRLRGLALQTAIQTALDKFDAADGAAAHQLRQITRGLVG